MIEAINVSMVFGKKRIINNLNTQIHPGEFISITGESGKGKTTLLNMLGLLEMPSNGNIIFEGIVNPSRRQTMLLQRNKIGYLFQNYALVENESVENNLKIALEYRKNINKDEEIKKALYSVGLDKFEKRKIYTLSGGEQQRVALARIFIKNCSYIFADEPTGNLDTKNRNMVFDIIKKLNDMGKTIMFVTHDEYLSKQAHKRIDL